MWPGLVGKGSPGAEPTIDLDTMLDLTAAAESSRAHASTASICSSSIRTPASTPAEDELQRLRDKIAARGLVVGSLVAPVWPPTGGGAAMGVRGDAGTS